jgi:D-tagatose-1,6-bisphosphate aldolase subunit GatZ/KbaZ
VIASVVQPGVEFDHHNVIDYGPAGAQALSHAITAVPNMVYEAHSTDYQTRGALRSLVKDHFAILKVGPGLTFAMREALWALDAIDQEITPEQQQARLRDTVLSRMREHPKYWERYYHGSGKRLSVDLQYSLSDRVRYYWPDPEIEAARVKLFENLSRTPPPISLLSQHLPHALHAVREGAATRDPLSLAVAHVSAVLDDYHHACHHH